MALAAACCLCTVLLCSPGTAQDGGDSPADDPVIVLADGLVTGSDALLLNGTVLPPGEPLFLGDVVVEGAMINLATESSIVMISGSIAVVDPGMVLFAGGPHCACKCGPIEVPGGWVVQIENSPNCAEWGVLSGKVGRPCIHPVTHELLVYTQCAPADSVQNPPE